MRTETMTRTLYQYHKLSAAAQARARDWFREGYDYPWAGENRSSLDAFCQAFPVRAMDWSYDPQSAAISPRFTGNAAVGALTGSRLVAYLHRHYGVSSSVFTQRKCFSSKTQKRLSRVIMAESCCPFTGYYMDEVLLDPLRQFLRRPGNRCFEELLSDCLLAWACACRDDWDSQLQDDAVAEAIEANDYEFTGDGKGANDSFRWASAGVG